MGDGSSLLRIDKQQARLGMYVHALEGSWMHHPFWRTKFLLTKAEDVTAILDSRITGLVINLARGIGPAAVAEPAAPVARAPVRQVHLLERAIARALPVRTPQDHATRDRAEATRLVNHSKRVMRGVFDAARLGKAVRAGDVVSIVDDISASIEHNAHALIGVTRLKSKDEYTYLHSVAVCALMVNLAKRLGLAPAIVHEMGLAGLLHDIGKMGVPVEVLNKPAQLDDDEFALVRAHPGHGAAMLARGEDIPALAIDVCLHHHEKIDGTGYPERLKGDEISLAARMGAICDVYDALTSNRSYKAAWAPAEAIGAMWGWDAQFDRALLFKFMQSIAVFPVGMLVRLRSNRLAVVLDNGRRASRPRVRAFFSTIERAPIDPIEVVITDSFVDDQIVGTEHPGNWGLADWEAQRDHLLERGRTTRQPGAFGQVHEAAEARQVA
jgi:HD-GYP domain-containing protein (c-di-GMP phosphodiesterase class II)